MRGRTLAFYAAPALCLALPTLPVAVFLPAFYADTLGLGLTATGAALLLARGLDVVTDPIVGQLSDHLPGRWGRRKPLILAGSVLAALALLALVLPPAGVGAIWLALWSTLLALGWTLMAVPYTAWGAELSTEYRERTRITAAREGVMLAGILLAGAMPAVLGALGRADIAPMVAIAILAIALGIPGIWGLLRMVPEPCRAAAEQPARLTRAGLRAILRNGPFTRLLGAWFLNGMANGLPAATFILYLDHRLGVGETERNMLILAYFLAAILALPFWVRLSRRIGKHRAWCIAMIAAIAAFAFVPLLPARAWAEFLVICLVTGAALGADMALPPALQADVVDYDTWKAGQRRTGLFFALWSMATKLSLALSVGLGLPALAIMGFRPEDGPAASQTWPLLVIYAALPIVFKLSAIALVWRHPITARRQRAIAWRLARRAVPATPGTGGG